MASGSRLGRFYSYHNLTLMVTLSVHLDYKNGINSFCLFPFFLWDFRIICREVQVMFVECGFKMWGWKMYRTPSLLINSTVILQPPVKTRYPLISLSLPLKISPIWLPTIGSERSFSIQWAIWESKTKNSC